MRTFTQRKVEEGTEEEKVSYNLTSFKNSFQMQEEAQDDMDQIEDIEKTVVELTQLINKFSSTMLEQESQSITSKSSF